ncbi:copper resistance CopC family protein [Pseudarthrobacter sp. S9]|uniref:copper resistance CopC family protein n=1 Tax=Pseudarthrobacter sp. S9 TaxID=3418421 RepID=UPI003CFFFD42
MRLIRQLLSALLGVVVLAAVLLGGVGPASAHDAAESTSPASGATLAAAPEKVSVTFSRNPLALGSQILVTDAGGTNWADGAVEIVDNVASQKLRSGAPAGLYTVAWRVASSDGHPIEGTFTFTVTAGAGAGAGVAGSTAAAVPTLGTAQPGTTAAPEKAPNASEPFPWSLVIFVGTAVGILVALGLMTQRRLTPAGDEQPGTEATRSERESED